MIKIGSTQNKIATRFSALQNASPFQLCLLGSRPGGLKEERWYQAIVQTLDGVTAIRGEWFETRESFDFSTLPHPPWPIECEETDIKSASMRILLTPEQLATWRRAANISHEGNLSMFVRSTLDNRAEAVINADNAKDAYK